MHAVVMFLDPCKKLAVITVAAQCTCAKGFVKITVAYPGGVLRVLEHPP